MDPRKVNMSVGNVEEVLSIHGNVKPILQFYDKFDDDGKRVN